MQFITQNKMGDLLEEECIIELGSYIDYNECRRMYLNFTEHDLMNMCKYDYDAIEYLIESELKKLEYDEYRCYSINNCFVTRRKHKALIRLINCTKVNTGLCSFQYHHYYRCKDLYENTYIKINKIILLHEAINNARMLSPILNPNSILMKTLGKDIVVDILATHFGDYLIRNKYVINSDIIVIGNNKIMKKITRVNNVIKLLNDLIEIKTKLELQT